MKSKKKIIGVVAGFILTFMLGIGAGILGSAVGNNGKGAPEHLTETEQYYIIKLMEQEGSYDGVETYLREQYSDSDMEVPEHVISLWEAPISYSEKLKAVEDMRKEMHDYESSDEWIMRTSFWDEVFFLPEEE